jgi:hypothetical protein
MRPLSQHLTPRTGIHVPAGLVGAAAIVMAYLLVTVAVLPGIADVVVALPDTVQLGLLLLLSSGTRFVGGWFAVRRVRQDRGLRRRSEGVPSALAAAVIAWVAVTALTALSGKASGTTWLTATLLLELVRWPAEAALGGMLAFPGPPDLLPRRRS